MTRLVFDEWLWADLNGENGDEARREAVEILDAVFKKCDQLVSSRGSPFLQKFYDMAKLASIGDVRRKIVEVFKAQFLENSEKLCLLQAGKLQEMPHEMEGRVKEDDRYLICCYLASEADLLVTTDNPLIEALSGSSVRCKHRKDFVSEYLQEHRGT
jgi:acyl-CoA-binding protein